MNQTKSPWIYHEIAMTNLVRKKALEEYRDENIKKALYEFKSLDITYDIRLDHLNSLNQEDLNAWDEKYYQNKRSITAWSEKHPTMVDLESQYALNILYKNKNLI